jgi:hypothetical protein
VIRSVRSYERGRDLDDEGRGEHGAECASIEKGGPKDNHDPDPDQGVRGCKGHRRAIATPNAPPSSEADDDGTNANQYRDVAK